MTDQSPVQTLHCTLPVAPDRFLPFLRAELDGHDRPYHDRADGLTVESGVGPVTFTAEGAQVRLLGRPAAGSDGFVMRQVVIYYLDLFDPGLAERLVWNLPVAALAHPPNFRRAQVVDVTEPGAGFLRLRLRAAHTEAFARSGLHLRLLLPPEGRAPVWPGVDGAGRTVWPQGADRLHDPVYTIRAIDPVAGWLDIDVFRHGLGRTCRWAPQALGAEVGLMGPGGGWFPQARSILIAGDETALPAIARILEAADPATQGEVLIEIADPAMEQPLCRPAGMTLHWLPRGRGDLPERVLAQIDTWQGSAPYLWFAAEDGQASRLRAAIRQRGTPARGAHYIAGYWTRDAERNR